MSRGVATRYAPALVALHWVTALIIFGLLGLGFFVLADMPNADPAKLGILKLHMAGGMLVFVLTILRYLVRAWSARPAPASTGSPFLDRLAAIMHSSLYAVVILMIVSGWSTGFLIRGAFLPNGALPASFAELPTFQAHAFLAALLSLLILAHVAAALYHQFALKDRLFARIWFGRHTVA